MKSYISFTWTSVLFFFLFQYGFAQTKALDSLKNLLTTATDTTEVNILRILGEHSRRVDRESALKYGQQSVEKSKEIGFTRGEMKAYYALGLTCGMTGGYAEALNYFNKCLALAKENNEFLTMTKSYNSLGIVYKRIGDYPRSKDNYLKGLRLTDSLNLSYDTSKYYTNLGILSDLMGQKEEAVKNYQKSLEVYKGPDKEEHENIILGNLAIIDANDGKYDVALKKYLKIAAFYENKDDKISLCTVYSTIGHYYSKLKVWELSQQYLQKSLAIAEELSLKNAIPETYHKLASLMADQNMFSEAIEYATKNLDFLPIYGDYKNKMEAHELAFEIYEAVKQYPKATFHLKKAGLYRDSLLNESKIKDIESLQIQHDVYLKDKELRENELELALLNATIAQDKKRLVYLSIIAGLLLLSMTLLYFRYLSKKKANRLFQEKNELISEQNKTIEKINDELEKRMLRAQMNPHFIFNSLNSIQHLIISSEDKVNALKYLTKFSKLLRQVLESSVNINSTIKEEIDLLTIYLELESLRFDNAFTYHIQVDEKLDVEEHEMPLLLVQPYVENAIVHGLMPKKGPKILHIAFNDKIEHIECIVKDNGIGIDSSTKAKKSHRPSRGMSITEKRINAMKRVSNEQLVTVQSLGGQKETGTKVTILIPKQEQLENQSFIQQVI